MVTYAMQPLHLQHIAAAHTQYAMYVSRKGHLVSFDDAAIFQQHAGSPLAFQQDLVHMGI